MSPKLLALLSVAVAWRVRPAGVGLLATQLSYGELVYGRQLRPGLGIGVFGLIRSVMGDSISTWEVRQGIERNKDLISEEINELDRTGSLSQHEKKRYKRIGSRAAHGDRDAMDRLKHEGVISRRDRVALKEGARGNLGRQKYAATGHLGSGPGLEHGRHGHRTIGRDELDNKKRMGRGKEPFHMSGIQTAGGIPLSSRNRATVRLPRKINTVDDERQAALAVADAAIQHIGGPIADRLSRATNRAANIVYENRYNKIRSPAEVMNEENEEIARAMRNYPISTRPMGQPLTLASAHSASKPHSGRPGSDIALGPSAIGPTRKARGPVDINRAIAAEHNEAALEQKVAEAMLNENSIRESRKVPGVAGRIRPPIPYHKLMDDARLAELEKGPEQRRTFPSYDKYGHPVIAEETEGITGVDPTGKPIFHTVSKVVCSDPIGHADAIRAANIAAEKVFERDLADDAAVEENQNKIDRDFADEALADKARDLDDFRKRKEKMLQLKHAGDYKMDPIQKKKIDEKNKAENAEILKEKAASYLDEGRDSQKKHLTHLANMGDPAAKAALADLVNAENEAKGTLKDDPKAAAAFSKRLLNDAKLKAANGVPSGPGDTNDILGSVAEQVGNQAEADDRDNENEAAHNKQMKRDRDEAERKAIARALLTGATGPKAEEILRDEQDKIDKRKAVKFGNEAAKKALRSGLPIEKAVQTGERAEAFARGKMTALAKGADEPVAEEIGAKAEHIIHRAQKHRELEYSIAEELKSANSALKRSRIYRDALHHALAHGFTYEEAEEEGRRALRKLDLATSAIATAEAHAAHASAVKHAAEFQKASAAETAERAAAEEKKAAKMADAIAKATGAPRRDAETEVKSAIAGAIAEKKAVKMVRAAEDKAAEEKEMQEAMAEAGSRNHQRLKASRFFKMGRRQREQEALRKKAIHEELVKAAMAREEATRRAAVENVPGRTIDVTKLAAANVKAGLAHGNEEMEINRAADQAYRNVKRYGGSEQTALAEAQKAGKLKAENMRHEQSVRAKSALKKLVGQRPMADAVAEAHHESLTETGHSPAGATISEIISNAGTVKEPSAARKEEEMLNSVKRVIPDSAKEVPLSKATVSLPLNTISSVRARTEAEDRLKKEQMHRRDLLRNKVTSKYIPSGLPVVKLADGYLNAPESTKAIVVKQGKAYFTPEARNRMESEGIDVSALKSRVVDPEKSPIPNVGEYFEAELKDMRVDVDVGASPRAAYNDKEKVDIAFASSLSVFEGKLEMVPWEEFSKKFRPAVFKEIRADSEGISEETRKRFEKQEALNKVMNSSNVELYTTENGESMARVVPVFGVVTQMKTRDAFEKMEDEKNRQVNAVAQGDLNVAREENIESVLTDYIMRSSAVARKHPELLNDFNPFTNTVNPAIAAMLPPGPKPKLRDPGTEENRLYNIIAENSPYFSKALGLEKPDFEKRISGISPDHWLGVIQFYRSMAGNHRFNKILKHLGSQPFYIEFKQVFPKHNTADVYTLFGQAVAQLTSLKDMTSASIVSITPLSNISAVPDPNAIIIKQEISGPGAAIQGPGSGGMRKNGPVNGTMTTQAGKADSLPSGTYRTQQGQPSLTGTVEITGQVAPGVANNGSYTTMYQTPFYYTRTTSQPVFIRV